MNTSDAKATGFSSEEDFPLHFSEWLKRRRQKLDLTQEQLAQRASCSVFALRKMESGERRPSRQLAGALAEHSKSQLSIRIRLSELPEASWGQKGCRFLLARFPADSALFLATCPGR